MRPRGWFVLLAAPLLIGAAIAAEAPEHPVRQYVGVTKCKKCHTSAKKGGQFKVWSESKHSHAFEVLASDSALAIAGRKGVKDPQHAQECLQCHVTGYGESADHFTATWSDSQGVGCESCHGAGSDYWSQATMRDIRFGKATPEKFGLTIPTKETCAKCHNEKSPTGRFVDWPADSAKIAHKIPKGADKVED